MKSPFQLVLTIIISFAPAFAQASPGRISAESGDSIAYTYTDVPDDSTLAMALDELVVRHISPISSMKNGVLTTNLRNSGLQHAGSAIDVLRHIPLVSIGSNDQIEVFGRGTPAVYINGRKVTDLRELNQLQSENIRSIDVITNPGTAYSADITSVVRIRTQRQRGEGFSASAGISESYDKHFNNSEDISLRYRKNDLEVFVEGSFSTGKHAYTTGNDQWSTDSRGDLLRQDAISVRLADMKWGAFRTGLSYNLTPDHSLGAFYNYSYWRKYETLDNVQDISLNNLKTGSWLMNGIDTTLSAPTHNVNIYYNGKISNIGIDLNADYFERDNTHNFFFNERNMAGYQNDIFITNTGHSRMLAEKLVMTYRSGAISLEFGEEYTQSKLTSSSINIGAPFAGTDTKVNEQNFAPFAELFYTLGNFRAGIGLRYEFTVNDYEIIASDVRHRRLKSSKFYPAASISWSVNDASLALSFTNKSIRPTYSQLSDILEYSTRSKYWRGNPELLSERFYNFQLSASWKYFFGMLIFTHTRDAIFQTYEPYEGQTDVSLITYRNIPTLNRLSSTVGFRHNVGIWTPALTLSIAKQWHHLTTIDGRKDLSSPIGRVRYENTFNLPHEWTAMLSFDFTSGGDSNNQGNRSRHSLDASLSKSLMRGDLIVRADATDLLNKSYLRYSIYNEVGRIDCLDTWPCRSVRLSLRYSFNTSSSRYKGTGAGSTEKSRM